MTNIISISTQIYKSARFGVLLGVIFALSIPSHQALAYATNTGSYSTMNGGYSTNGGSNGTNSGSSSNGNSSQETDKVKVTTEPAQNVGNTSATLSGTVYVTGGTATVWFQIGVRADALTGSTRTQIKGVGDSGASDAVTALAKGTKYFYRIVAKNGAGTSYGVTRSFTTTGGTVVSGTTGSASSTSTGAVSGNGTTSGVLGASAASSRSFLPSSLLSWIVIVILVGAIVAVVRMIQIDIERKKEKKEEEKKPEPSKIKFA